MAAVTITISSPGRAIVADGRLVAGESADVSVVGGVPAALYLVAASRDVVAACTSFVAGESSATGELNLATVPLSEIVAEIPAGRAIPLQAILEDAAGDVIGYGLVAVVSAPMPDELDPLDEDFIYAKLSDLRDYLTRAEADERYAPIGSATPIAPSTDPSAAGKPADAKATGDQLAAKLSRTEAAQTYATQTELGIVDNVAQAATADAARANYDISQLATVARTGSYNDLTDKPTIPTVPVQSVNGKTGAVVLGASDVGALTENDLGNLSANIVTGGYVSAAAMDVQGSPVALAARLHYALGSALNASGQLADRTCNHVFPLAGNVADIVLTFPDVPSEGGIMLLVARDFLVLVTNTAGNTGNITFTPPTGATVYGDGFTHSPASGETWLYSVTEVADNTFWVKSVKMEVAQ